MKNPMSMNAEQLTTQVLEINLDDVLAAGGAVDKESVGYALGYVIGSINAEIVDGLESLFGNLEGL